MEGFDIKYDNSRFNQALKITKDARELIGEMMGTCLDVAGDDVNLMKRELEALLKIEIIKRSK